MRFRFLNFWMYAAVLLGSIFASVILAQDGTGNASTPEPDYSYLDTFPVGLVCSEATTGIGPTWDSLTIGISTLSDFEELYGETQPHYDMLVSEMEFIGELCVTDSIIIALQVGTSIDMAYLTDYIAVYGLPDAVTYGNTPFTRLAFWFDEGIATDIYINPINPDLYGIVAFVIYFPYQEVEGFEQRWPYLFTRQEGIPDRDINVSDARNPFNYDEILATITAQPPRIPLPTRTPAMVVLTPLPSSSPSD